MTACRQQSTHCKTFDRNEFGVIGTTPVLGWGHFSTCLYFSKWTQTRRPWAVSGCNAYLPRWLYKATNIPMRRFMGKSHGVRKIPSILDMSISVILTCLIIWLKFLNMTVIDMWNIVGFFCADCISQMNCLMLRFMAFTNYRRVYSKWAVSYSL